MNAEGDTVEGGGVGGGVRVWGYSWVTEDGTIP